MKVMEYVSVILEPQCHIEAIMRCVNFGWTKCDVTDGLGVNQMPATTQQYATCAACARSRPTSPPPAACGGPRQKRWPGRPSSCRRSLPRPTVDDKEGNPCDEKQKPATI